MQQINYVSFIVTLEGIKIKPDSVCTNIEWPEPASHSNIQVVLSFVNFYREFISSFLHLPKLMTDLLKWGKDSLFL